jgi:hypothetical protein
VQDSQEDFKSCVERTVPRLRTHADESRVLQRQIAAPSQHTEVPGNAKIDVFLVTVETADIPSALPHRPMII